MSKPRWIAAVCLSLLAFAVFGTAAVAAWSMRSPSHVLTIPDVAPNGILSLQLAPSRAQAVRILEAWNRPDPDNPGRTRLAVAQDQLAAQRGLIEGYAIAGLLLGLALLVAYGHAPWRIFGFAVLWLLAIRLTVYASQVESHEIAAFLEGDPAAAIAGGALERVRLWAQLKYCLLLVEFLVLFAGTLIVFRRLWDREWRPSAATPLAANAIDAFQTVAQAEACAIDVVEPEAPSIDLGPAGEPWIRFRSCDVVGLALSGGGIRSATFNLGILQGLQYLDVLKHVHYLATVSGGGYVGGFWTAWRHREVGRTGFPMRVRQFGDATVVDPGDAEDVRHLREFSRFLAPRVGFFETEMWSAIIAFVGGLLPSLAATLSLMFLALFVWLGLNLPLMSLDPWYGAATLAIVTGVTCWAYETSWWTYAAPEGRDRSFWLNLAITAAAIAVAAAIQLALPRVMNHLTLTRWPMLGPDGHWMVAGAGPDHVDGWYVAWWHLMMGAANGPYVSPRLFDYPIAWFGTTAIFLVLRLVALMLVLGRGRKGVFLPAFDRVLMRIVGLGLIWTLAAVLWHIGVNLTPERVWLASGGAIVTGGAFGLMSRWIGKVFRQAPTRGVLARAKPFLPQILAYATIGLMVIVLVSVSVGTLGQEWLRWYTAAACAGVLGILMVHLDPAEYSLHAFYRDRICRAYLGASNPAANGRAADNRATEYRPGDDIALEALRPERPLHLVCCAANDLSGDQVGTLSRGAKSATITPYGVSIGGYQAAIPRLSLGSALTASAAAFNSTMGSVSKRLGPAVSFLMAALNLRLGIWVPHPATRTPRRRLLPGLLFYKELFGLTDATPVRQGARSADVHLSDGGHFENLALYELVRRHCRYIVVSDCGEDPAVAFDDIGNAARRIREDFGVEIDIDLTPLAPDAHGRAQQHAVVGTVHYDRRYDKGVIVVLKPTLTGDEPADVLQYERRNHAFPHEPTSDQFYDEAQWESYRRLGVHAALSAFRFTEHLQPRRPRGTVAADQIFTGIRQEWWPTPRDFATRILTATERFTRLESQLVDRGVEGLLSELFPEVPRDRRAWARVDSPSTDEQLRTVAALVDAAQVFEDVWIACQLETQWNHPLNVGWSNAFARWATAPTFQAWWPVLSPMFSPGFQRFMRERFPVLDRTTHGWICAAGHVLPRGLSTEWWTNRVRDTIIPGPRSVFEYVLPLTVPSGWRNVQVGLVLLTIDPADRTRAIWTSEELFVPPSLWGAGVGGAFLKELLGMLPALDVTTVDVYIVNRHYEVSRAQRSERVGFLEFYRGFGFQMIDKSPGASDEARAEARRALERSGRGAEFDAWVQMRWTAPARR